MQHDSLVSLEDYTRLYKLSMPIDKLKDLGTKDYQAFKEKQGLPVALCDSKKFIGDLPYDPKYFPFYKLYRLFWIIPIEVPSGKVCGYLFKAYKTREYRSIFFSKLSPLFGFYMFKDYRLKLPIVLVEGAKDCIYAQRYIYPFTLALNTARLSSNAIFLIKYFTNKIITAFDMDKTGLEQREVHIDRFRKEKVMPIDFRYSLKDLGEYFQASPPQCNILKLSLQKLLTDIGVPTAYIISKEGVS